MNLRHFVHLSTYNIFQYSNKILLYIVHTVSALFIKYRLLHLSYRDIFLFQNIFPGEPDNNNV